MAIPGTTADNRYVARIHKSTPPSSLGYPRSSASSAVNPDLTVHRFGERVGHESRTAVLTHVHAAAHIPASPGATSTAPPAATPSVAPCARPFHRPSARPPGSPLRTPGRNPTGSARKSPGRASKTPPTTRRPTRTTRPGPQARAGSHTGTTFPNLIGDPCSAHRWR